MSAASLIDLDDLSRDEILAIWKEAASPLARRTGNVAWSFEGNGIRTRTTFIQAFQQLGLDYVELPNFLKTAESVEDLAGYMDAFYDLYVIREGNHERLQAFAAASQRPVINAMSRLAHPCEVLADACYLHQQFDNIADLRILLWGPMTNVFRSWLALARVFGFRISQYCPQEYQTLPEEVNYLEQANGKFDVLITDAWPRDFTDGTFTLQAEHLPALGNPLLLPVPPVTLRQEIGFIPASSPLFAGYAQKRFLLPVQAALVAWMLETHHPQQQPLSQGGFQHGFGARIHQKTMAMAGGVELSLPPRSPPRRPPDFSREDA